MVNFLKNIHKRHPITHPLRRGMGCLFVIQHLIDILPQFLQSSMQYHTILDCIIMAFNFILEKISHVCWGPDAVSNLGWYQLKYRQVLIGSECHYHFVMSIQSAHNKHYIIHTIRGNMAVVNSWSDLQSTCAIVLLCMILFYVLQWRCISIETSQITGT